MSKDQLYAIAYMMLKDTRWPTKLVVILLSRPSFREMINFANPEAEAALWASPRSIATYAMRLFRHIQPQVVKALSAATSKIHISFDGWTTKGGKRGFFGVIAHFADDSGVIYDPPIDLPQLTGAHSGDAIATTIAATLKAYNITSTITTLAEVYDFNATHRRLRCGAHILNLIG